MRILKTLSLASALCGALQAEKSAFFVGAMYEMGGSTFKAKVLGSSAPKPSANAITQGLGVHVGYNQLFGQKGWIGLRYYGFYNWGVTNFGEVISNSKVEFVNNTFNLSGYGVGLDLLLNLINTEGFSLGFFGGLAVGGNTWSLVKGNNPQTKAQWLVNGGIRTVIAKHSGIELGFKVPMMQANYIKNFDGTRVDDTTLYLKRDWAFTAAYYFYF
ncbi:outer membrane protein [Helicobacter baculiformis]|uniref:Outer membrane protein n=1 Tax=Helicobacter baculiformis TaxID=427351 RepID=A0ABV7ZIM7_9HELI|nr:outer membrane protein [Helicobacter baculiformis]